ncbi:MAG: S41 family peptidase [Acidobacteria bacterium]|nr:S41 family peptidase [Acidobacteriota bacterium]
MRLRPSRAIFSLAVLLALSALAGGIFGGQVGATTKEPEDVQASLQLFNSLLSLVEENYATEVDSDKAVYGAIDGMLRTLDPHSRFFTPKEFTALREDQRGRYYGLGITVTTRFGKVTVVSPPFLGSPAEKVGLRVGDVISHVNGEPTLGMDLNEVVSKLKGPRGTSVRIKVVRPGVDEPLEMTVIRDEIAKFTVSNAFRIRDRIGYIKLESFAETTGTEIKEALRKLDAQTLDGLVFDLRGNPGGLLPEAIEVSETFLQKGQMIVETKGRTRGSNRPYASQRINNDNLFPLVILINPQSASASEIVAGAIQDHDRGLIVGETSFGKGLVQSVYTLSKNAGLALTTQKWYTPSGRLIQRDYSQISQFDYYNHRDATKEPKKEDIHYSDLGRVVYGGGGITPDYIVKETKIIDFQDMLGKRFSFYTFVQEFLSSNSKIDSQFQVSDELLEEFRKHITKRGITFDAKDFEENREYMKRLIRYEVFYNRLGVSEAQRVLLGGDPQVLKAIELIPEAKLLAARSQKQLVERREK